MQSTITPFNTGKHHIYTTFVVTHREGSRHSFIGIMDTGAPRTEFADSVLQQAGFLHAADDSVAITPGLQTHKYGKIVIPAIEICGHTIETLEVLVSKFDPSWGIGALIGLDFFRRFRVTIDYQAGHLVTEPLPRIEHHNNSMKSNR